MRKLIPAFVCLSLLANLYYFISWFHITSLYETQKESVDHFSRILPIHHDILAGIIITFTALSLLALTKLKGGAWRIIAVVQGFALFLLIWQYL